MKTPDNEARSYLWLHLALLATACLLLLGALFPACSVPCPVHDVLHLYCPLCGGTRCVAALLRFDFASAFRANALIPIVLPAAAVFDLIALVRLIRKRDRIWLFPRHTLCFLILFFLVYAVVRNVLLYAFGIDPLGDFIR